MTTPHESMERRFRKKFRLMKMVSFEEVDGIFALEKDQDDVLTFITEEIERARVEERERCYEIVVNDDELYTTEEVRRARNRMKDSICDVLIKKGEDE